MKTYKILFDLLFMLIVFASCRGQQKSDISKDINKAEIKEVINSNAPNSITRTIKQDRNGNIWIAAFDGVFKYDGKSFAKITDKVSSARFFSVLEDRKGNFWFCSVDSGVFYYNGISFLNFTAKNGLGNDGAIDIYEDRTGNIWFGTASGARRYDGKSFKNYLINENPVNNKDDNDINSIVEDKTGKFWFGTRGNAFIYDKKTFTILSNNGKPFTNVRKIIEDKKGNIWLGGNDGLWRYDGSVFTNFSKNFVGYIYEDKNGNIWTSSQNFNSLQSLNDDNWILSRYEAKTLLNMEPAVTKIEPKVGMLSGILEAADGSIWFGGMRGVYRYEGNAITHFKSKM